MRTTVLVLIVAFVVVLTSVSVSEASFWEVESQTKEKLAPAPASEPARGKAIDCGKECSRRCSKASRARTCLHFCGMCCKKCQCVPSGFYGNKDECPCYRDWKNRKGGGKCP